MDRDQIDRQYMQMALEMAALGKGYTNPNPMVGAVIVKDGQVIAKGYHHCCGQGHAEVEAFRDAGDADVTGATMYDAGAVFALWQDAAVCGQDRRKENWPRSCGRP